MEVPIPFLRESERLGKGVSWEVFRISFGTFFVTEVISG